MPKMILMVLDDLDKLEIALETWHSLGASGVTVVESSGLARLTAAFGRDDLPLFPRLDDLLEDREVHHRTLFTVVGDEVDMEAFFDATEAAIGRMDTPGSGILLALPVLSARGLIRRTP